jgi:hypothetical protein
MILARAAPQCYTHEYQFIVTPDREIGMSSRRSKRVSAHKYTVGQTVYFAGAMMGRGTAGGGYRVIRLLPPDGGDFQYRIKSATEAYERVAKESQLEREH